MSPQSNASSPVLGAYPLGLQDYILTIFVLSATTSFSVFVVGLFVVYKRPRVWKNMMFRILLLVQIMNCLRFILRLILARLHITSDRGCRVLLALNNGTVNFITSLCMFIVVYLQLTIIHPLSPFKIWPRALLIGICVLCSFAPQIVYLVIPSESAGLGSFCDVPFYANTSYFRVLIGTVIVWALLFGTVSLISMAIISAHIFRTSKSIRQLMTYGEREHTFQALVPIYTTAELLNRTLRTVVWFPLTPIMSQWFNAGLIIARYITQKPMHNLEYVNVSLLTLMTFFMVSAFFVNPLVLEFFRDYRRSWSLTRRDRSQYALAYKPTEFRFRSNGVFSSKAMTSRAY